jgi:hypothetical protein
MSLKHFLVSDYENCSMNSFSHPGATFQTTMAEAQQPQRCILRKRSGRANFSGMDGEDEGAAHVSEHEAQGAQGVVKAKRVKVHLDKTNLSTFI